MRHARLGRLVALAAVAIAGCDSSSDDEGANPPTIDIYIGANVEAPDDATVDLEVYFYWPDFEYLRLGDGNTLTACVGTVCTPLTYNRPYYEARLPYVAETAYTISLSRRDHVSAPNTFVTLPVPFTILAPAAGSHVTDGQTITLQWSPPGINTRTSASGFAECEHPSGEMTSRVIDLAGAGAAFDSGTVSFSMAYIMSPRPWPTPRDPNVMRCAVELTVRMARTGVADSAFRATSKLFSGIERSVTIEYTPSQR